MEKIFIVGEGFIGEHLCRYFTEKYSKDKVIYFTDTKLKIIDKENYNICDINSIFKYNSIDCIVNSLEDMEFIQKVTKISNINQYHQIMTKKNKNIIDLLKKNSFKVTLSYINMLYGPGQEMTEVISLWIDRIVKNKSIELKRNYTRGWVFIMDYCRAVDIILQQGVDKESYGISSDFHITDLEVIHEIIRLLNKSRSLVRDNHAELMDKTQEHTKIKELGWQPVKKFKDGLELTIKWYMLETFGEHIKNILIKAANK